MFDLTMDELDCLRICRRHVNYRYEFPVSCIPSQYLNTVRLALIERGYIQKVSATMYEITKKGREALHQALLLEEEAEKARQQREQEVAEHRAYEDAKSCEERAHLHQQTQKQFRHDWRITAVNLLGGFILGAVADHFFDVVGNTSRTVFAALIALGLIH